MNEGPFKVLRMKLALVGQQGWTIGGTGLQGWQGQAYEPKNSGREGEEKGWAHCDGT